jgi:hypothetical protein
VAARLVADDLGEVLPRGLRVVRKGLEQVHDVAAVRDRDRAPLGAVLGDGGERRGHGVVHFVDPALLNALVQGLAVHLGDHGDSARNLAGLALRARHPAKAGGDKGVA